MTTNVKRQHFQTHTEFRREGSLNATTFSGSWATSLSLFFTFGSNWNIDAWPSISLARRRITFIKSFSSVNSSASRSLFDHFWSRKYSTHKTACSFRPTLGAFLEICPAFLVNRTQLSFRSNKASACACVSFCPMRAFSTITSLAIFFFLKPLMFRMTNWQFYWFFGEQRTCVQSLLSF